MGTAAFKQSYLIKPWPLYAGCCTIRLQHNTKLHCLTSFYASITCSTNADAFQHQQYALAPLPHTYRDQGDVRTRSRFHGRQQWSTMVNTYKCCWIMDGLSTTIWWCCQCHCCYDVQCFGAHCYCCHVVQCSSAAGSIGSQNFSHHSKVV